MEIALALHAIHAKLGSEIFIMVHFCATYLLCTVISWRICMYDDVRLF